MRESLYSLAKRTLILTGVIPLYALTMYAQALAFFVGYALILVYVAGPLSAIGLCKEEICLGAAMNLVSVTICLIYGFVVFNRYSWRPRSFRSASKNTLELMSVFALALALVTTVIYVNHSRQYDSIMSRSMPTQATIAEQRETKIQALERTIDAHETVIQAYETFEAASRSLTIREDDYAKLAAAHREYQRAMGVTPERQIRPGDVYTLDVQYHKDLAEKMLRSDTQRIEKLHATNESVELKDQIRAYDETRRPYEQYGKPTFGGTLLYIFGLKSGWPRGTAL